MPFTPVDRARHASKLWRPFKDYSFAASEDFVPVVGVELAKAALAMPMAFVERAGNYMLVAVLSIIGRRNMYVGPNGRWLGVYIPAAFRSYPFRLMRREDTEDLMLCVDEASLVDDGETGEPLFDGEGNLSAQVNQAVEFLKQIEISRKVTEIAVKALADAGLIQPWGLKVNTGEEHKLLRGLFCVDERKLNALDDASYLKLRKAAALPLAYAHLLSLGQVTLLERLEVAQAQFAQAGPATTPGSLDEIFVQSGDQILNFDALLSSD
jgi:hypothetical protein